MQGITFLASLPNLLYLLLPSFGFQSKLFPPVRLFHLFPTSYPRYRDIHVSKLAVTQTTSPSVSQSLTHLTLPSIFNNHQPSSALRTIPLGIFIMSLVSGPGRGGASTGHAPDELKLAVEKHVEYIQSLDTVRPPQELFGKLAEAHSLTATR